MLILGIDPSLTATGVAVLCTEADIHGHDHGTWQVTTIRSKPNGADYRSSLRRMEKIATDLVDWVHIRAMQDEGPDLVIIEGPAFSKNNGMAHERAGLWWRIYERALDYAVPVLIVKPNVRAKYATGRGNAGKDEVMLSASRRYADADITDNNNADAAVLAAMGARYLGEPIEKSLPAGHLAAMKTVV
jgi:crossover junction endodeoxyribonuclease RuvC